MVKVAGYIYGWNKKKTFSYPFDKVSNYLIAKAKEREVVIDEIYADGYDELPQGLDELLLDIGKYDGVVLYSLEGLTMENLKILARKQLFCVTAPWLSGRNTGTELSKVIRSKEYYDKIKSLNIRMGIAQSDKDSGGAPYGYRYNENGKLEENPEEMATIDSMLRWRREGMSIAEICKATGLLDRRVYRILNKWSKKNV
mgnify:CR=1 FL=1